MESIPIRPDLPSTGSSLVDRFGSSMSIAPIVIFANFSSASGNGEELGLDCSTGSGVDPVIIELKPDIAILKSSISVVIPTLSQRTFYPFCPHPGSLQEP